MKPLRESFLFISLVLLLACKGEVSSPPEYSMSQCDRVVLTDGLTGEMIIGVEDIAVDWHSDTIFLSAYNRRAVENSVNRNTTDLPQGGVYSLPMKEIFDRDDNFIAVTSLIAPSEVVGGLHPHGISFDPDRNEVLFINRTYMKRGQTWVMKPTLQSVSIGADIVAHDTKGAHCAANNLITSKAGSYTSFDHEFCDWRASFENLLGWP